MGDQDFLVIGLSVTAIVVIANLLAFVLMPMLPVIFQKLKNKSSGVQSIEK